MHITMDTLQTKIKVALRGNTIISLRKHSIRWEGTHYVLCCPITQFCVFLTPKWKMLLELLDGKRSLHDCKEILLTKPHHFSAKLIQEDIYHFVLQLLSWGFVKKIGSIPIEYRQNTKPGKDAFPWMKRKHIAWIFTKPMKAGLTVLLGLAVSISLWFFDYFPHSKDFFWSSSPLTSLLSSFVLGWIFLAIHEFAHYSTAKYYGLRAGFSLSTRLYFLVAQTTIYSIFMAQKKHRMHIYAAGMIVDLSTIAITILLRAFHDLTLLEFSDTVYGLLQQIALIQWMTLLWQFFFFMKTDVYHMVADGLGCESLIEATKTFLGNKLLFVAKLCTKLPHSAMKWLHTKKRKKEQYTNTRERELVPLYAILLCVGVVVMVVRFFYYFIPVNFSIVLQGTLLAFESWQNNNLLLLLQAMAILAFEVFHLSMVFRITFTHPHIHKN